MNLRLRSLGCVARTLLLGAALAPGLRAGGAAPQARFDSPEAAVKALTQAAKAGDRPGVEAIFGPDVKELMSGDPKQDTIEFADFARSIGRYAHLTRKADDRFVLSIGAQNWPLPIPLVRRDGAWCFDTAAGRDEIVNRRVGADELTAIGVCRAYVVAQREFAEEDHDGSGVLKFAQRIKSSKGAKDGLYWPAAAGEEESPLGPLVAEVRAEGYGGKTADGQRQPFHGYLFRILNAQGAAAPGGAYDYVINGNMVAGFALVAYPAHWGESGVMTFIVNQWGKVYERNLGEGSAAAALAMTDFNPDADWSPVETP